MATVYQCPFCELRFLNVAELNIHIQLDHPDRSVPERAVLTGIYGLVRVEVKISQDVLALWPRLMPPPRHLPEELVDWRPWVLLVARGQNGGVAVSLLRG